MGIKMYSDSNTTVGSPATKYSFRRKAGRSIIERRPIFSPDGGSVLIIVENIVRVYNIETGDCARTLETESPVKELVSIQFPENESYNLYACSVEGCVTTWTWENGTVLRETNLPIPDGINILTFDLVDTNECFVTAMSPLNKHLFYGMYSVKTGEVTHEFRFTKALYYEDMIRVAIGWCNGDRFAAITNGTPRLSIQNLYQPHIFEGIPNTNFVRIMSVAAHPTESVVATTDALGRVTVFRGNLFQKHGIGKEILHWHFLPCMAVSFSLQGSYLYTGGIERVLVKWTEANLSNKANEKMFIPRLPGIVRHVSTNNCYVAAALSNNSVIIADTQMRVVSTILECGGISPAARALGTPLLYHQRLGGLLLGGRTGHLQLFSTNTNKILYNIDITAMNSIPSERHNLLPLETEVTCAAVSGNGSWLVTSEYRNDGITYPEERLKFWSLQVKSTSPFKLNTCVNLSHGGCNVVSIALSKKGDFCVTAGADQKFRIWKRENTSQTHRKKVSWNCLTACYYSSGIAQFLSHDILNVYKVGDPFKCDQYPYVREFDRKDDIVRKIVNIHKEKTLSSNVNYGLRKDDENDMGGVAISHDGSLIAAWFGCKLTLWDTHLCNLRTILSHPVLRPKGVHVQFGNDDAAHYLVCSTEKCVAVWSLLSLTVKWLVQLNATCLTADPLSNKMAIVTTNNDLYIFTPHSSTPILTKKRLVDPEPGVFKQCTFGTTTNGEIRVFVMRNDSDIYCLEPEQSEEGRLEAISHRNLPASHFSALVAEQQLSEVIPNQGGGVDEVNIGALANTAIAQFLSAAPHMIPPVSLLCTSFLQHISGKEQSEAAPETNEEILEVDESSDDDEVKHLTGQYAPRIAQLWTPNYEKVKEKRLLKIAKESSTDLHTTESIFGV